MTVTKEMRRVLRTIAKNGTNTKERWINIKINERAAIKARWNAVSENGMIAVCRSGMDCDCTQYAHVSHVAVPLSVFQWMIDEDEHRQWLDGPESTWFAKPSDYPQMYRSSDRALEAYEEGHISTVTWTDLGL